jgi:hypothetical protein
VDVIKHNLFISGVQRIDQQLQNVTASLENQQVLGSFNQIVLEGQARELRAARWLIGQIWGSRRADNLANSSQNMSQLDNIGNQISDRQSSASITNLATNTNVLAVQASLWDRAIAKLLYDK